MRLPPIANYFEARHRLQIGVTGSNFPMHERNPHCDVEPFDERFGHATWLAALATVNWFAIPAREPFSLDSTRLFWLP
jgi:predicted acyl esterase